MRHMQTTLDSVRKTGILTSLVLFCSASAVTTPEKVKKNATEVGCPSCIRFDSLCYNTTHLLDLEASFRQTVVIKHLGLMRATNVLYYSFEPKIEDREYFKVAFVALDTPTDNGVISGQQEYNFGVFDVNQDNRIIYLGGSDGIFEVNTKNRTFIPYSSIGDTITGIVLKDYLYFSKKGQKGIVKKKGEEFLYMLEDVVVKNFVLDKDVEYIVVYLNGTGLHAFESRTGNTFTVSSNPFIRGLTVDLDGVVYAWWIDGIYKVVFEKVNSVVARAEFVKVADIPFIGAMTFDNDNDVLFTFEKSLFRLSKTNLTHCKDSVIEL